MEIALKVTSANRHATTTITTRRKVVESEGERERARILGELPRPSLFTSLFKLSLCF